MIHSIITLVTCWIILILKLPVLLVFLPAVFYVGREFTQAEYRYISQYCKNKRENMPWYAPFTLKARTWKGLFDFLLPCVVSGIAYSLSFF